MRLCAPERAPSEQDVRCWEPTFAPCLQTTRAEEISEAIAADGCASDCFRPGHGAAWRREALPLPDKRGGRHKNSRQTAGSCHLWHSAMEPAGSVDHGDRGSVAKEASRRMEERWDIESTKVHAAPGAP